MRRELWVLIALLTVACISDTGNGGGSCEALCGASGPDPSLGALNCVERCRVLSIARDRCSAQVDDWNQCASQSDWSCEDCSEPCRTQGRAVEACSGGDGDGGGGAASPDGGTGGTEDGGSGGTEDGGSGGSVAEGGNAGSADGGSDSNGGTSNDPDGGSGNQAGNGGGGSSGSDGSGIANPQCIPFAEKYCQCVDNSSEDCRAEIAVGCDQSFRYCPNSWPADLACYMNKACGPGWTDCAGECE